MILVDAAASTLFPAANSAFSVAAWVKATAATQKSVFSLGRNSASGQINVASGVANGALIRIVIVNDAGTTESDTTGAKTALDNTWHHVAVTLDTSRGVKRYIDGALDGSTTYTSGGTYTFVRAGIGLLRRSTNTAFWPGSLAHVAAWTRTLAANEALSLASGLPPSHLAPTNYWPLWGKDSPEPDIGNGTHVTGTLTGTAAANEARVALTIV